MNISMSKNTEAIDITEVSQQYYTINNTNICSDTLAQLAYSEANIKIGDLVTLQFYFSFDKKIERLGPILHEDLVHCLKPESANFS